MTLSVGSTGALMVMIIIALWLWRGGQRPIQSTALNLALVAMIVGCGLESFSPTLAMSVVRWSGSTREDSCWLWGMTSVNVTAHVVALGAFVKFILATIARKVETPPS